MSLSAIFFLVFVAVLGAGVWKYFGFIRDAEDRAAGRAAAAPKSTSPTDSIIETNWGFIAGMWILGLGLWTLFGWLLWNSRYTLNGEVRRKYLEAWSWQFPAQHYDTFSWLPEELTWHTLALICWAGMIHLGGRGFLPAIRVLLLLAALVFGLSGFVHGCSAPHL